MKDLDKKHKATVEIYTINNQFSNKTRDSSKRGGSSSGKKNFEEKIFNQKNFNDLSLLNKSCDRTLARDSKKSTMKLDNLSSDISFTKEFATINAFSNTYSDASTPVRDPCGESSLCQKISKGRRIRPELDLNSHAIETKRSRSYSKQKKIISRNPKIKVSKTSKEDTLINMMEKKLLKILRDSSNKDFTPKDIQERLFLIEECMKGSISNSNICIF